jgi:hypothetical protein
MMACTNGLHVCEGLNMKCSPQAYSLKAWSPAGGGTLGIARTLGGGSGAYLEEVGRGWGGFLEADILFPGPCPLSCCVHPQLYASMGPKSPTGPQPGIGAFALPVLLRVSLGHLYLLIHAWLGSALWDVTDHREVCQLSHSHICLLPRVEGRSRWSDPLWWPGQGCETCG